MWIDNYYNFFSRFDCLNLCVIIVKCFDDGRFKQNTDLNVRQRCIYRILTFQIDGCMRVCPCVCICFSRYLFLTFDNNTKTTNICTNSLTPTKHIPIQTHDLINLPSCGSVKITYEQITDELAEKKNTKQQSESVEYKYMWTVSRSLAV